MVGISRWIFLVRGLSRQGYFLILPWCVKVDTRSDTDASMTLVWLSPLLTHIPSHKDDSKHDRKEQN